MITSPLRLPLYGLLLTAAAAAAAACSAHPGPEPVAIKTTTPSGVEATMPDGAPAHAVPDGVLVVAEPKKDRFLLLQPDTQLAQEVVCEGGSPLLHGGAIACASSREPKIVYVHVNADPALGSALADRNFLELRAFAGIDNCGLDDGLRHAIDAFRRTVPTTPNGTVMADAFVQGVPDASHVMLPLEASTFPELAKQAATKSAIAPRGLATEAAPVAVGIGCACQGWGTCIPGDLGPYGLACLSLCSASCSLK